MRFRCSTFRRRTAIQQCPRTVVQPRKRYGRSSLQQFCFAPLFDNRSSIQTQLYCFRHAHRNTFQQAEQIRGTWKYQLFRGPKTHINHHNSPPLTLVPATSIQHASIFTAIILQTSFLIIYYFSNKFSFSLFLLLSCIDLTFVLLSLCVPCIGTASVV